MRQTEESTSDIRGPAAPDTMLASALGSAVPLPPVHDPCPNPPLYASSSERVPPCAPDVNTYTSNQRNPRHTSLLPPSVFGSVGAGGRGLEEIVDLDVHADVIVHLHLVLHSGNGHFILHLL